MEISKDDKNGHEDEKYDHNADMDKCNNDNDAHDCDEQEEEGAFAPELGTGVGQLGLQSKGEKGGQVLLNLQLLT